MEPVRIPTECPECNSAVEIVGPKMFCRNRECPAQSFGKIKKFLKILDIQGIGDGILGAIVDEYGVETPIDLLKVLLNDDPQALTHLSMIKTGAVSLGLSRAEKIVREVNYVQNTGITLTKFIQSLQIQFLGRSNSERVAKYCGDLDTFLKLDTPQLLAINKIGYEMSDAILVGINQNREFAVRLLQYIGIIQLQPEPEPVEDDKQPAIPAENQVLGGASFCISGKLSKPKKEYYEIIENLGGDVHTSIKNDTTYLVTDDTGAETNKTKKAKDKGISIINEEELVRILKLT